MRLFIFKSESGALSAFAGDSDARVLPTQHGPWHPIGVVRPEADPPHNFKRPRSRRPSPIRAPALPPEEEAGPFACLQDLNKEASHRCNRSSIRSPIRAAPGLACWHVIVEPNLARSAFEITITFLPFAGLWLLSWAAVHFGYWELSLLLAVPGAAFLVRLFMIQHDCGHGSFFRNRRANDGVGRVIGVLTLTPYDAWRRAHASHHATSGHLDRRGIGDIDTLTVREFNAFPHGGACAIAPTATRW